MAQNVSGPDPTACYADIVHCKTYAIPGNICGTCNIGTKTNAGKTLCEISIPGCKTVNASACSECEGNYSITRATGIYSCSNYGVSADYCHNFAITPSDLPVTVDISSNYCVYCNRTLFKVNLDTNDGSCYDLGDGCLTMETSADCSSCGDNTAYDLVSKKCKTKNCTTFETDSTVCNQCKEEYVYDNTFTYPLSFTG